MNKKLLKILSISLLLFVGFFIKISDVRAETYTEWSAPIPLITTDGKLVNADIEFAELGGSFSIVEFEIKTEQMEFKEGKRDVILVYAKNYGGGEVKIDMGGAASNFNDSKYLIIYYDEEVEGIKIKKSNKGAYENQYKNLTANIDEKKWEYLLNFYVAHDDPCKKDSLDDNNNVKYINPSCDGEWHPHMVDYLKKTGGIVFRGHTSDAYYDKDGSLYTYYNAIMKYKKEKIDKNEAKFSISEIYKSWTLLQDRIQIPNIDKNTLEMSSEPDVDTRAFGPDFYKSSLESLKKYMGNDVDIVVDKNMKINLDNNKSNDLSDIYSGTLRNRRPLTASSISKWFYYAGRYLFDKNLELYKKYYKYLYADQIIEAKTKGTNKEYLVFLELLENTEDLKKTTDSKTIVKNDPCSVYCQSCLGQETNQDDVTAAKNTKVQTNLQACTACKNQGGGKYQKCKQADTRCASCKQSGCYDDCMNGILGDFKTTKEDTQKKLDNLEKNIVENMITTSLSLANAPELDINFNKEGAKLKCEDVSLLHTVYMVMIILAPILVVVLGSLDFFKAMLQSDEQKMNKFKKQFPKRIIMLVLLILVPIIVSFLTKNIGGIKDTLLNCVVNGSK